MMAQNYKMDESIEKNGMYSSVMDVVRLFEADASEDRDLLLCECATALAGVHEFGKSFGLAKLISGGYEKSLALIATMRGLSDSGDLDTALFVLDGIRDAQTRPMEIWQRALVLLESAKVCLEMDQKDRGDELIIEAIRIARDGEAESDLQTRVDSSSVLGEIAEFIAITFCTGLGVEIAESIHNEGVRNSVLKRIRDSNIV